MTGTMGQRTVLSPTQGVGVRTPHPPAVPGRCVPAAWAAVSYNYHEDGDFVLHVVTCALAAGQRLPAPPPGQEAVGSR